MSGWGAALVAPDRARFRIWAPARTAMTLEIEGRAPVAMAAAGDGWFEAEAAAGAGARYRYRLDADTVAPDPASRAQAGGVHGWSVVVDPDAYRWRTPGWRGRPWEEVVLLEVHAGIAGGFAGIAGALEGFAATGITAIELMPVAAFPGTRNWGYDGVLPYAPAEAYGSPDELKALVDRAHALGLMVFLDVVYNHFGPDGNYLPAYAPTFFDEGKHTPWGGAVDPNKPPVADFFVANARMWIEEYRIDGLRFDAVHAIRNDAFLDRLAVAIRDGAGPDRHVHLVLENENNDPRRLGPGRFDAQWNDDFHNVLHCILTGERDAYYADFADRPAERLARCLAEGFIYQGEPSPNHDGTPRGHPTEGAPPTRFVAFLQNHDQVGNRALGERLVSLTDPDRLRAATALLMLGPQIPLLFMGEAEGCATPFLFFTDFHDELADAVREGRRREFAKFAAFEDEAARERIPDPNALATFEASRPGSGPDAAAWRDFHRTLIALRRERIVPLLARAEAGEARVLGDRAVACAWPLGDAVLTIAINLGDGDVAFDPPAGTPLYALGTIGHGRIGAAGFAAWMA